jgi:hypothetical protein
MASRMRGSLVWLLCLGSLIRVAIFAKRASPIFEAHARRTYREYDSAQFLAAQKGVLDRGMVPCTWHPCQKQPSTNMAKRSRGNIKSGRPTRLDCRRHPTNCDGGWRGISKNFARWRPQVLSLGKGSLLQDGAQVLLVQISLQTCALLLHDGLAANLGANGNCCGANPRLEEAQHLRWCHLVANFRRAANRAKTGPRAIWTG